MMTCEIFQTRVSESKDGVETISYLSELTIHCNRGDQIFVRSEVIRVDQKSFSNPSAESELATTDMATATDSSPCNASNPILLNYYQFIIVF